MVGVRGFVNSSTIAVDFILSASRGQRFCIPVSSLQKNDNQICPARQCLCLGKLGIGLWDMYNLRVLFIKEEG